MIKLRNEAAISGSLLPCLPHPQRRLSMVNALLLFASIALPAFATPAAAQAPVAKAAPNWQPLSDPGDFMSFSWDRASVVRDGDVVRVVVRLTPRIISPGPGYADFLTEITCSDSRTRVVRTTNYGLQGQPIVKDHPKAKFRGIKSDHDRTLHAALCPASTPTS